MFIYESSDAFCLIVSSRMSNHLNSGTIYIFQADGYSNFRESLSLMKSKLLHKVNIK